MANVWVAYREGLRLLGARVAEVPLETAVSRLDIAPWRLFSATTPDEVAVDQVAKAAKKKRVLLEVREEDQQDLGGFSVGLYDSPYSPEECLRRLKVA
jgi:hypothetical protein